VKTYNSFEEVRAALAIYTQAPRPVWTPYKLERMTNLMTALGNPQNALKIVHVAGTSGKTSTSYYTAAMLGQMGYKVGLTVSPHLDEVNERLQINLEPVPEQEYCRAFGEFHTLLTELDVQPSYFELLVAFAFWYFERQAVDYAVIEVGLGGLLDGTNVINREDKVCIITDIGIDHAAILGHSLGEIASQKAGIIMPGNHVFCYTQGPEVDVEIASRAAEQSATLYASDYDVVQGESVQLPAFQRRNWQLAARAYSYLARRDNLRPMSADDWLATQKTYVPGRMDIVQVQDKTIIMDGAHNPQKMAALVASLRETLGQQKVTAVISFKEDKDIPETLKCLDGICETIIATEFIVQQDMEQRSMPAGELAELCNGLASTVLSRNTPLDALNTALETTNNTIVISGSFFLLHQVRPSIRTLIGKQ
jgi:dihydrofolate synthase/folylpolyglutamate synthase